MIDPSIIKPIVSVIMVLLDLGVVGIGIVYIIFGMIFGTRKSLRRALSFIIPFGIFIVSIGLLTNLIMNTTIIYFKDGGIETGDTILQFGTRFLSEQLANLLYEGDVVVAEASKIIDLAKSLATSIIRFVIYVVGLFIIAFIIAPFIRFIAWITYRVQIKGKPKQKLEWASRIGGMGIASVRYIIFILIVIIPISGGISTLNMLVEDAKVVVTSINQDEQKVIGDLDTVESILTGVDEGMDFSISRLLSNATRGKENRASYDMKYLGLFFNISTEDAKFNIFEEYARIRNALPIALNILDVIDKEGTTTNEVINSINEDDVYVISNIIKDSELVNLLLPAGYDYLCYYLESQDLLEKVNITPEMLKEVNINQDFDLMIDALTICLTTIISQDLYFETEDELFEALLNNQNVINNLQMVVDDLLKIGLVDRVGLPVASIYITNALPEDQVYEDLKPLLTSSKLKLYLENDLKTVLEIVGDALHTPLKDMLMASIKGEDIASVEVDFSDPVIVDFVEDTINKLMNSYIISGNENTLVQVLVASLNIENFDVKQILFDENGKPKVDWSNEKYMIGQIVRIILETYGSDLKDNIENPQKMIITLLESDSATQIIEEITKSTLIEGFLTTYAYDFIQANEDLPEQLKGIFTKDALIKLYKEDLLSLVSIINNLYNTSLKEQIINLINEGKFNIDQIDLQDESMLETLKESLIKIFNFALIDGNEEIIIEYLIELLNENNPYFLIDAKGILYDENLNPCIDWNNEISTLFDALVDVLDIFGTNFDNLDFEILKESLLNSEEKIEQFVSSISKSKIVRSIVVQILPDLIKQNEALPEDILNFFTTEKMELLKNQSVFEKEMKLILSVINNIMELDLTDLESFTITEDNKVLLKETLTKLLDSVFIKDNEEELFRLFVDKTSFATILEENSITLDYENVTNWQNELTTSIDIVLGFASIATDEGFALEDLFEGNMSEEKIDEVAKLFDNVGKSELFKGVIYDLIDNIEYDIEITDQDKQLIEESGYGNEIRLLLKTIGDAKELLESEDLSTLKGSDVEAIMLKASDGIITSKVVGTILETALGPNGLDINPVDENGNPKYDFSNPTVLKEQASNIANLIDLANNINNFDINDASTVTDITEALKKLEDNSLASDTLKEITGVDVDLKDINIEEEATLIEDVYQEYTNASNKDEFIPSEETIQKIEESELASKILEMLGIYSK